MSESSVLSTERNNVHDGSLVPGYGSDAKQTKGTT
jgi:hypothetical protein